MRKILVRIVLVIVGFGTHEVAAQYGGSSMFSRNSADRAAAFNLMMYQKAKAEGKNMKKWWKGESGLGLAVSSPLKYTSTKLLSDPYARGPVGDSVISGTTGPGLGLFVNSSTNHLLVSFNRTSALTFSWGFQCDVMRWSKARWIRDLSSLPEENAFISGRFGIPLTLEYRSGCDVNFEPDDKSCFSIGGGIFPSAYVGGIDLAATGGDFQITPIVQATFGMYIGVCMKIRAAYIPSKLSFDFNGTETLDRIPSTGFTANSGSGSFMIGINIMAHSQDWDEASAWRVPAFSGGGRGRGSRGGRGINGRMF